MRTVFFHSFTLVLFMLAATPAQATEWMMDRMGNYSLVAKGQSLTLECQAPNEEDITSLTPMLYYYPVCGKGCKDVAATQSDNTRKATIMVDDKAFSLPLPINHLEGILIRRANELPELFEALVTAKSITIYSGQISPHYSAFEDIKNPQALTQYYEDCVSGKK